MTYAVKSIFKTLQGEGANAGRAAVFCRFSGCNLWSGREEDRATAACNFCDTDFVGGVRYDLENLVEAIEAMWGAMANNRFIVFTGGEPLLQLDSQLVRAVQMRGFEVAIETNGTIPVLAAVDWVCVSPKAGTDIKVTIGSELKFIYPQDGLCPEDMEHTRFDHYWLQPMDGPRIKENTELAVQFCLDNPKWRLSLQTHKMIGIQ